MPAATFFAYIYQTPEGTVSLLPEAGGRYRVMFEGENLGSYHSAEAAADDVSGGYTYTPSSGIDLGDLGIPDDLGEWERRAVMGWSGFRPG